MKRFFSIVAFLLLAAGYSMAQNYAIEVLPDKKVIYVDKLNLPDYLNVEEVLQMLPELASRGDQLYDYFDIQFDGKSVGASYYVVLSQTKLGEIEKIEISTSSVSTQQKSEVSGTINLIPLKPEEGFVGDLFFDATTEAGLLPSVSLNYKKNKLQLYGNGSIGGNWTKSGIYSIEEAGPVTTIIDNATSKDYVHETARVNFVYDITGRDELKGWLLESWRGEDGLSIDDKLISKDMSASAGPGWYYSEHIIDSTKSGFSQALAHAMIQYKHTFANESSLKVFAGFESIPNYHGEEFERPHIFDGEVKYEFSGIKKDGKSLNFEVGSNMNFKDMRTEESLGKNLYLSPYGNIKYRGEKLSLDFAVRYQHFVRNFSLIGDKLYQKSENDIVGDINAVWQFKPNNAFHFTASRNLLRPSDEMLYPRLYYSESQGKWFKGNRNLAPAYLHSIEIEYIFNKELNGGRQLFVDVGAAYTRADDLIEECIEQVVSNSATDPQTIYYTTYMNTGVNNILTAEASVIYTHGIFTLALAGNLFTKNARGAGLSDTATYYNISLNPILNLKKEWTVTGKFIYNSPVVQNTVVYGDCFLAKIRVGKKIKDWTIHAEISDIFDYLTTDYVKTNNRTAQFEYDLYGRYFGIGFSYRFGNLHSFRN